MRKFKSVLQAVLCIAIAVTCTVCAFACSGNGDGGATISVSASSIELKVGESYALSNLKAKASDGTTVSYSVEGTGVIEINGDALNAIAVGSDNLVLTAGSTTKKITVTVTEEVKTEVTVTIDGVATTYLQGATVTKPADPTKAPTVEKEYVFAGWFIKGTETQYDFIANQSVEVESRFNEQAKKPIFVV